VFDWEFPGGMVEPNEDPKKAVLRELVEETDISITDAKYLYAGTDKDQQFSGFFFYAHVNTPNIKLSFEHDKFVWVDFDTAQQMLSVEAFKYILNFYQDYVLNKYKFKLSVKALVFNNNKVLLLRRSPSDTLGAGKWDLPGGGVDDDEDIEKAIRREAQEEANLSLDKIDIVFGHTYVYEQTKTVQIRVGVLSSSQSENITLSHEHSDALWIDSKKAFTFANHQNWPGWSDFVKYFAS
jgi:8-oxo-dGTP diphosphatase